MKGASSWGGAASEISGIGVPPLTEAKAAPEPANRNGGILLHVGSNAASGACETG